MTNGTRFFSLALLSLFLFSSHGVQIATAQVQEPPKFQKPVSYRTILGVRGTRTDPIPAKIPGKSLLQDVQYEEPVPGSLAVGSGVRKTVQSQAIDEPVDEPVDEAIDEAIDPIDDPFGDLAPGGLPQAGKPAKNQQESILRRPANDPGRDETANAKDFEIRPVGSGQDSNRFSREPFLKNELGKKVPMAKPTKNRPRIETRPLPDSRQDELRQQVFDLDCDEINGVMLQKSIQDIALNLTPKVDEGKVVPEFCTFEGLSVVPRDWQPQSFVWTASGACSKPLYFQHIQLERYGHSRGPVLQPVLSAAHFLGNVAIYPYKAGIHPPNECMYALGYYRPGDAAPWLREPWPWSVKGALSQAMSTAGYGGTFR